EARERPVRQDHAIEFADDRDRDALAAEIPNIPSGTSDVSEAQRRIKAADGEILWAQTRSGLVRTWDGHPDHVVVLFDDVAQA
ncbi:MAG: hypothetical protein HN645_13475, partial [Gemmatimonadales bacterium]|nr:hypothetical protein [Gemmatimonadales bacterium]